MPNIDALSIQINAGLTELFAGHDLATASRFFQEWKIQKLTRLLQEIKSQLTSGSNMERFVSIDGGKNEPCSVDVFIGDVVGSDHHCVLRLLFQYENECSPIGFLISEVSLEKTQQWINEDGQNLRVHDGDTIIHILTSGPS